jgi:hypothetical protein
MTKTSVNYAGKVFTGNAFVADATGPSVAQRQYFLAGGQMCGDTKAWSGKQCSMGLPGAVARKSEVKCILVICVWQSKAFIRVEG